MGNPVAATLTPGQQSDLSQAAPLLEELEPHAFLADKAYDADVLIENLEGRGIMPVIPPKRTGAFNAKQISRFIGNEISSSDFSASSKASGQSPHATTN